MRSLTTSVTAQGGITPSTKKYLIYLCDSKRYCFGLGDRQRGLASVYLLAEVTNRTFGLVMTSPSNFTEFYQPSLVNWDIPESELRGKSSIVLEALGPKTDMKLDIFDLNANFTQDVVYIRTNQKFHYSLVKNPHYKDKFPEWARVPHWKLYQNGWMRLMMPTPSLRKYLNEMLLQIFDVMKEELKVWEMIKSTACCKLNEAAPSQNCTPPACKNQSIPGCCNESNLKTSNFSLAGCSNKECLNKSIQCSTNSTLCSTNICMNTTSCKPSNCSGSICERGTNNNQCSDKLGMSMKNSSEINRISSMANILCSSPPLPAPLNVTREFIQQSKQYEPVNLNMVCAHIRLGHSKTMPFENNVRNKVGDEQVVWEFLKPYVAKGHHVYVASDSEDVRQTAKKLFGYRVHISTVPIVHIASVQEGQDKILGFRLTLMEQLLLATSCSVLMVSYSGFSMKAAQFRDIVQPGIGQVFMYGHGTVRPTHISGLL
ncbi:hypothetical protein Btru_036017 [Bulinus truncatus]|nr:hypothetical protein Btru_036017 [Bulinus truncatus]